MFSESQALRSWWKYCWPCHSLPRWWKRVSRSWTLVSNLGPRNSPWLCVSRNRRSRATEPHNCNKCNKVLHRVLQNASKCQMVYATFTMAAMDFKNCPTSTCLRFLKYRKLLASRACCVPILRCRCPSEMPYFHCRFDSKSKSNIPYLIYIYI